MSHVQLRLIDETGLTGCVQGSSRTAVRNPAQLSAA
jgi:hypothetical protein